MADCLPFGWDSVAMVRNGFRGEVEAAELLCWQMLIDGRPMRIDQALVWCRGRVAPPGVRSSTCEIWALLHLCRHPMKGPDEPWMPGIRSWPAGPVDRREFDEPPVSDDCRRFVDEFGIELGATEGYRRLSAGLCGDAWRRAFGEDLPDWIRQYF